VQREAGNAAAALCFFFAPLMASLFLLARQGRAFELAAYAFMFSWIFVLLGEYLHPKVQLRKKPRPKPEIRLNINGPSN